MKQVMKKLNVETFRWLPAVLFALTSLVAMAISVIAGSQANRQAAPKAGSSALWEQMERGPHTGSLQDSLVAVEVTVSTSDGAVKRVRRGNGLIIRCDGFVLVPSALFNTSLEVAGSKEEASGLQITIVVRPGMAGEKRFPAKRPRFERAGMGYTVAKIDNWHGMSFTTETPASMPSGESVGVYWSEWDTAGLKWLPVKQAGAKLGVAAADEDDRKPGRRPFFEPIERVPVGSVIISKTGRAIGIVASNSAEKGVEEFAGFDTLHLATNCVVPETPERSADEPEANGGARGSRVPETPTVKVQGGPLILPGSVVQAQPDMEGAKFACVPSFEIDKYEVTNRQYLAFWESLPAARKSELWFQSHFWPAAWAKRGAPFPEEIAEFPVVGVPTTGAEAFARSQGKRLPTPYEWCLAALGPEGSTHIPDWIMGYIRDRQNIWEKACAAHIEYRSVNLARSQNSRNPDMYQLPWIASSPELMEASNWSKNTLEQLTGLVRRQYKDPDYLEVVGSRDVDESPCGARDMLMNAPELVVTYPGPPTRGGERFMTSEFPPMKLPQNAEFVPRPIELIGAREENPPFPHLSRLFKRLINGPSTADLVAWSNVAEMQRILTPPGGWEIRMSLQPQLGYMGRPPGRGLSSLGRAPGLRLWEQLPPHHRVETGLPIPLEEIDRRVPSGPSLTYTPVTGFRCVRGL
jgi:hypothetical protein